MGKKKNLIEPECVKYSIIEVERVKSHYLNCKYSIQCSLIRCIQHLSSHSCILRICEINDTLVVSVIGSFSPHQ